MQATYSMARPAVIAATAPARYRHALTKDQETVHVVTV